MMQLFLQLSVRFHTVSEGSAVDTLVAGQAFLRLAIPIAGLFHPFCMF